MNYSFSARESGDEFTTAIEMRSKTEKYTVAEVSDDWLPLFLHAPDLLEALRLAKDEIRWWVNEHDCCDGHQDEVVAKIDAVIKKAEVPYDRL